METAFSILMFTFSGALLLYAGLLALTKDYKLLPYRARIAVRPKDPKKYAAGVAKCVALTAPGPALSGLVGLWSRAAAIPVLIVVTGGCVWRGMKFMKGIE